MRNPCLLFSLRRHGPSRTALTGLSAWLVSGIICAQAPVITAPADGAVIPATGTTVQIAANPSNNHTIIHLLDLATGSVVWQSGYLYGTNAISQALPPGLRTSTGYRIGVNSYNSASVAASAAVGVVTDNVPTPSPYPVITAPDHGRPVPQTGVTVRLAGNPYNYFTVAEVIDLTTNTFLHQGPELGHPSPAAPFAYPLPLTFDPTHAYRIQARNYSNIGGLYQTEITVNNILPTASVYTPVSNASLPQTDYAFRADPANAGTPPQRYKWSVEPVGTAVPVQAPLTRYGQAVRLGDYLVPGRTYRARVAGLMGGETDGPASDWTSFSLPATVAGPDTTIYQGKSDYALRYLDKTQIPTQILYDRVFPLAGIHTFNQDGRTDTSSYAHLIQAQSELYRANYENTFMPSPAVFKQIILQQRQGNLVPLSLLDYSFNVIDTLSLSNGRLRIEGEFLKDVAGRTGSPYVDRRVLVVSPVADAVRTGSIQFFLPMDLTWTNSVAVSNVEVRAGDANQVATLTPGAGAATFNYGTPGKKTIRFLVRFSDNTVQTTYASLKVF